MNIDEWAANQCGIAILGGGWRPPGYAAPISGRWTIKDPRCREIVREHFKIWTYYGSIGTDKMGWVSTSANNDMAGTYGKTIAEAEIACIEAIYEASKNGS